MSTILIYQCFQLGCFIGAAPCIKMLKTIHWDWVSDKGTWVICIRVTIYNYHSKIYPLIQHIPFLFYISLTVPSHTILFYYFSLISLALSHFSGRHHLSVRQTFFFASIIYSNLIYCYCCIYIKKVLKTCLNNFKRV